MIGINSKKKSLEIIIYKLKKNIELSPKEQKEVNNILSEYNNQ